MATCFFFICSCNFYQVFCKV